MEPHRTNLNVEFGVHHEPATASDRVAYAFTKTLRFLADTFFAQRYGHRAVVLETVAGVPGMVGAALTHLNHCGAWRMMPDGYAR